MNRSLLTALISTAMFLLTSCGPMYKTSYEYVPPRSNVGKMCTMQCNQNKMMCEQLCQMKDQTCRSQARQEAFYEYESYKQGQTQRNLPVEKSLRDFDDSYFRCRSSCDCSGEFNACYQTCGGTVNTYQVCTAFCDKA